MKPLRLTMRAFGPFAEREEIDFRRLGEKSFFLIHGPTGGGKTTILDAICYALYGDTSGGTRPGSKMRSDHADPTTLTEIVFDFALGEKCYRVHRVPEQERPRKRGDGMTSQRPEAALYGLEMGKDSSLRRGSVLETQWSRVTAAVEDLLGFRSDQFRQVIMLPQGKFQDLLLAGSKERGAILEILFQTEIYRRIEEALKAGARELTDEMESLRQRHTVILEQAEASGRQELDNRIEDLKTRLDATEKHLDRLRAREAASTMRLQAGRELDDRFREREDAERELGSYVEAGQEMRAKKERLKLARKAAGIAAVEETMEDRLREVRDLGAALEDARLAVERARKAKSEAVRLLAREKRREGKRRRAERLLVGLEGLEDQIAELEDARERLDKAGRRVKAVREDVKATRGIATETADRMKTLEKTLARAREEAAAVPAIRLRLEHARSQLKQRERLEESRRGLKAERTTLRALAKRMNAAGKRLDRTRAALRRLEQAWQEGQAGLLARTLEAGRPCPVCGSTEHPHPAHLPPQVPDQPRMNEQRTRVETAETESRQARDRHAAKHNEVSRLEAEVRSLEEGLGEAAGRTLGFAASAVRRLEQALAKAEASERVLGETSEVLNQVRRRDVELRKQAEEQEAALTQAEKAFEGAVATVRERERKLPKGIRTGAELQSALARARSDRAHLIDALEAAREGDSQARQGLAEAGAGLKAARRALRTAEREAGKAEVRFARRVRAAGFKDAACYAEARLGDREIERLAEEVDEYAAGIKAARQRLTRARQATRNKKRPDLARLERRAEDAKAGCDDVIAQAAGLRKDRSHLAGLRTEIERTERKMKGLERRYAVAGRIADVANGRNDRGITFQRFVLASLFDDVLGAASERLKVMSRGRFDLQLAGERADRRLAGGLDLEVYDSYTGTARPASTLSGGETFLAALSLALGLADVVQAYAGGIRLETVFVDEGFGSLDPESLDLAVRALMDLQRGRRLVGIISHVPELKERIDVRLEVLPTRRGSRTAFVGV